MKLRIGFVPIALAVLLMFGVAGCSSDTAENTADNPPAAEPSDSGGDSGEDSGEDVADTPADSAAFAWLNYELTDVETGEKLTIGELSGTPVYIQAFAVW